VAAWPRVQPHLDLSPLKRMDSATEECPQEVCPCQTLLPQLQKGLTHGMQLPKVLPSHPVPPRRLRNRVATHKHGERHGGIVPYVKPLLLLSLHRSGHGEVKVRVNSMLRLYMNDRAPKDYQLHIWVLWTLNAKEIIS
jgi:hypothetical protein